MMHKIQFLVSLLLTFPTSSPIAAEQRETTIVVGASVDLFKEWPSIAKAPKGDLATIEFWIRPDEASINRERAFLFILSNRGGRDTAGLSLTLTRGAIRGHVLGVPIQATTKLPTNRWSHIALTINTRTINKQAKLWLDGKLVGEELVLEPWPKTFEVAQMFSDKWNQGRVYTGQIGDVRVSHVVRYKNVFEPSAKLIDDDQTSLFFSGDKIPIRP